MLNSTEDFISKPVSGEEVILYCLKNSQDSIIRFKNSRRSREVLHIGLIIHHWKFFEQLPAKSLI